jgi:hypothetical protein
MACRWSLLAAGLLSAVTRHAQEVSKQQAAAALQWCRVPRCVRAALLNLPFYALPLHCGSRPGLLQHPTAAVVHLAFHTNDQLGHGLRGVGLSRECCCVWRGLMVSADLA